MNAFVNFFWNEFISHIPSRNIRYFFARLIFKKFEKGASILMHTRVLNPSNISISKGSVINQFCLLDGRGNGLNIEKNVDIGPYTHIWTLDHDPNNQDHQTRSTEVNIKDNVWISSRCTILGGVTLLKGSVVCAGAVVTKSFEEKSIIAGVPAKKIGTRQNSLNYEIKYHPFLK